jgi:hypothetical protein
MALTTSDNGPETTPDLEKEKEAVEQANHQVGSFRFKKCRKLREYSIQTVGNRQIHQPWG